MASTRIAIVRQALDDIVQRLAEMPASSQVLALREKAQGIDRTVRQWDARPPSEETRARMLKMVIELNVEVIGIGKT